MEQVGMWLLLSVSSIYDLTRKRIPVLLLGLGGALCIASMWRQTGGGYSWAADIAPGFGMLLLAAASREKIGYGDGFIVIILGLLEGGALCFASLCLALLLVSVCSVVLLAVGKVTAGTEIPFIPFILAAHVCIYAIKLF